MSLFLSFYYLPSSFSFRINHPLRFGSAKVVTYLILTKFMRTFFKFLTPKKSQAKTLILILLNHAFHFLYELLFFRGDKGTRLFHSCKSR
jgi:hypothetical protein